MGLAAFLCAVAVAVRGLVFLPGQPLQGGGDTAGPLGGALHPLVRAEPVGMIVVASGYLSELGKALAPRVMGVLRR